MGGVCAGVVMDSLPNGWRLRRLGDCVEAKPEYGANTPSIEYDESLPRYIRITDINDDGRLNLDGIVSAPLDGNEQYILREGDFLFARSGATVGKSYLYDPDDGWALFAGYLIRFRPDRNVLLPTYLKHFTQTHRYWFWVQSTLRAGAQPNINAKEYASLPIPLPPPAEQRAIAAILSTWDEAITLTERLIAALQERKRGLMQRLLTGEVREDWSVAKLEQIAEILLSNVDKKTEEDETPVRLCNYMDVFNNNYITNDIAFMEATASQREIDRFTLQEYDVILTKDSETPEDIAQVAVVTEELDNVICGYHLALIRPNGAVVYGPFLREILEVPDVHHRFVKFANGVTRFGLTLDSIRSVQVPIPSLTTQRRIVRISTASDEMIALLNVYADQLREQKKGLMQRLLTGEIRVQVDE